MYLLRSRDNQGDCHMAIRKALLALLFLMLTGCFTRDQWGDPQVAEPLNPIDEVFHCQRDDDCPDNTPWESFHCAAEGHCVRTHRLCDPQLVVAALSENPVEHERVLATAHMSAQAFCHQGSLCLPQPRGNDIVGICVPACPTVNKDHIYPYEFMRRMAMILTWGSVPGLPYLYDDPNVLISDLGGYPQTIMDYFTQKCGIPRCAFSQVYWPHRCASHILSCPSGAWQFVCEPL